MKMLWDLIFLIKNKYDTIRYFVIDQKYKYKDVIRYFVIDQENKYKYVIRYFVIDQKISIKMLPDICY